MSIFFALVSALACVAFGAGLGASWVRKDAMRAMHRAFEQLPTGPARTACIALRARWQISFLSNGKEESGVLYDAVGSLRDAMKKGPDDSRKSGEP